jgi:uncharacterized protein
MQFLIIALLALLVSLLTFFSGFGLGTLLMPAFAVFFPLSVAISATAVVHLANNIFKLILIGKKADYGVVLRFAITGAIGAAIGAYLLTYLDQLAPIFSYTIGAKLFTVSIVKVVIGFLIIIFALMDIVPSIFSLQFDRRYLLLGGFISGFFGGVSGHQGALRSAFLLKCGLNKEAFIGTGVVSAVIVDMARLLVYGIAFYSTNFMNIDSSISSLVVVACVFAFIGSFFGKKLLKKMEFKKLQILVGIMLLFLGASLALGLI